jgi:chromosome segregation ATPase
MKIAACMLAFSALGLCGCAVGSTRPHTADDTASASTDPASTDTSSPSSDQTTIQHHLDDLEHKISQLEHQLGSGQGALRGGSTFSVDSGGQETILERSRRLTNELATARSEIAAKNKLIADLHQDLAGATKRGEGLAERADSLSHIQDNLVTAQQELADRQTKLGALSEQLALSELARLRAERAYYLMASGLIKLAPGQTQELVDLQEQVRQHVKELKPADSGSTK